jgi:hypothetical protein
MSDEKPKPRLSARDSIHAVMQEVKGVGKNDTNAQQGFKYRGIDAVVNAAGPVMRSVGAFTAPTVLSRTVEHGVSKNGTATTHVFLEVAYDWYGSDDGEPVRSIVYSEALDTSDKATAKAMSVAKRTYLIQILELPTDEPDADADYIEQKPALAATDHEPMARARDIAQAAGSGQVVSEQDAHTWITVLNAAETLAQLQAAWEGAGKEGVTRDPKVIAAKDKRKKELQDANS